MSAVGAHSVRPSSVDHDARRARRLGAPPYKVSPFWASSFFRGEKGTKTPPGETHIAVRNRFPPAPARSPPDPRNLREPNSSSLPVTVRRGRGNDCPRNRAAAAAGLKSRWPGRLEQTGAPDRSGSNLCGGESAGGSQIRPPVLCRGMFPRYPVGEGLAPPAVSRKWPWVAVGAAPCGRPPDFGRVSFHAEGFALRGEFLFPRRKRNQNAAGGELRWASPPIVAHPPSPIYGGYPYTLM